MPDNKRMAGDYEITQSVRVGNKEVVYGVNLELEKPYFCALYEKVFLLAFWKERYEKCVVSEDYLYITELFAERIKAQCEQVRTELAAVAVSTEPITADMCYPNDYCKSIENKVVAIKASVFYPEFQNAHRQLVYITGGNGAKKGSSSKACFATNLYTGKSDRWERYEIQGEVKPECLPEWAKERLAVILKQAEQERKAKEQEVR